MPRSASLVLPGDLEILETLARHGNRHVLRCAPRDAPAKPTVLKCLLPPFTEAEAEDLRAEFLLLDGLAHPCWVRPRRLGALAPEGWFLELEECPGVAFARWPLRGWWPESLEIARQLLSGLETLHRAGYAHLDLGPGQVLIDPPLHESNGWAQGGFGPAGGPRARLLDLGMAAPIGATVAPRGTPGYLAPEILRGGCAADARADLYSLGALLFELFTGGPAFPGDDVREVLFRQQAPQPPDPGASAGLPPPVRTLVRELLHPQPNRRPTSALEVWERLREQAPREQARVLPARLEPGLHFAFQGREREIAGFRAWLDSWERSDSASELRCLVAGDPGIGSHRLAERLAAVAQTRGWDLALNSDRRALRWPRTGTTLAFEVKPGGASDVLRTDSAIERDESGRFLAISPGTLASSELERMLQGHGLEAPALRRRLVDDSLGVPGRLDSLARAVPREIDLAARYVQESSAAEFLATLEPPEDWIAQARRVLGATTESAREALILLAWLEDGCPTEDLVRWAGAGARIEEPFRALRARGYLERSGGGWRFRSRLWARAVLAADPAGRDRAGLRLLTAPAGAAPSLAPDASLRLALRLREMEIAERLLPAALRSLEAAGRLEDAASAWAEACSAGIPARLLYDDEVALPLIRTAYPLGRGAGELLPPPERMPSTAEPGDAERLMRAWSGLARERHDLVEESLRQPTRAPESEWARLWLRARSRALRRETESALADIAELEAASAGKAEPRFWARASRASLWHRLGRVEDARRAYAEAEALLPSIPEPQQVPYLTNRAAAALEGGTVEESQRLSLQAQTVAERHGMRIAGLHAESLRGGVSYQSGLLVQAEQLLEDLVWKWSARAQWDLCSLAYTNLALVLGERGRLGPALQACGGGWDCALRAASDLPRWRTAAQQIQALVRCGQAARSLDAADAFLAQGGGGAGRFARRVLVSRAEAESALGELPRARQAFRRAVSELLDAGSEEDACGALLSWSLHELEGPEPDRAAPLLAEARAIPAHASALTASLRELAEAEASLLAGGEPTEAEGGLRRAAALLDEQNRWYFGWRAHWRLAQAEARLGRAREAANEYATARSILTPMVESLGMAAATGPFLDLPAVRAFLEDLARA